MPSTMNTTGQCVPSDERVVLVIDDQQANVRILGAMLTRAGYEVVPAFSGADGLQLARTNRPDVVLLDMKMPQMDGFEVLARLREDTETADIPVIFLTADNERDNLVRAFAAGAIDYVTKPFVTEELLARVRTHIDLKRSRDALRRVAQEKQAVAELVAHDLRNYFGNIIFVVDMLRDPKQPIERYPPLIDSIRDSADSGMLFLQAFLEQHTGQARNAVAEPLACRAVVSEVVELMLPSAKAKGIELDVSADESIIVAGQRSGVIHVLQNLMSNAIKYSPPDSRVAVAVSRHGGCGRMQVVDRGPGISADDQTKLFQRFVRLSSQPTGNESSTGLGLALAKQQARAMGGDLWFEPRSGGGSVFTLELPLA